MKIILLSLIFVLFGSLIHLSYAVESCMCVAFRLDDIQDYWLNNVQMGIVDEFQKKNASLTIGIIGHYFGNDTKLVNFVKTRLVNNNPEIEIANHGWDHEHFALHMEPTQKYLLEKTNQKVNLTLGIIPHGFIAPYDDIDHDTITALMHTKLEYLSANETMDPPPYQFSGVSLYRFPETAWTGSVNSDNTDWINYNHDQTYAEILRSMTKYGYAIVVLHPQDFSLRYAFNYANMINQTQIHELDLVMDQIKKDGFKTVTISEIPKNANFHEKYPSWLDKVFELYVRGYVTENTIINTVNFLKSNQIISVEPPLISISSHPLHQNITATYFWVGEPASKDNQYIDNLSSAWDSKWVEHFGGVDDPDNRNGYLPAKFIPKENPFYFALPYDDFFDNGTRRHNVSNIIYWSHEKNWSNSESMVKNKWIKITKGNKTAYAQWEDIGPFVYDDTNYVFGSVPPKNRLNNNAGLDVSPAVRDYIELYDNNRNIVNWKFVDFGDVPDGPWKKVITTSQLYYSSK